MTIEWIKPEKTYKLRAPISDHAIYFTIVGKDAPESFFINSKEMKSFQWIVALMTSYSRQCQAGRKIDLIIADMYETFDPKGGYIIPDGSGDMVHGIIHHLGTILEKHVNAIS
jgi:hypothetical protein